MSIDSKESKKLEKIHVSGLQIGMYVSKLDVDWLDTPFLYQGFLIESLDDISQLEKYCEYVWVDRAGDAEPYRPKVLNEPVFPKSKSGIVNKVPMPEEYGQSHSVFFTGRRRIKSLLEDITLGNAINTDDAKEMVQNCLSSVLRNPNAMLWMSKIRSNDEYTSEHCLNVCILSIAFGRHLGKNEEELEALGLCGLLHDVGKMRVPKEILNKPSKLTPCIKDMVHIMSICGVEHHRNVKP